MDIWRTSLALWAQLLLLQGRNSTFLTGLLWRSMHAKNPVPNWCPAIAEEYYFRSISLYNYSDLLVLHMKQGDVLTCCTRQMAPNWRWTLLPGFLIYNRKWAHALGIPQHWRSESSLGFQRAGMSCFPLGCWTKEILGIQGQSSRGHQARATWAGPSGDCCCILTSLIRAEHQVSAPRNKHPPVPQPTWAAAAGGQLTQQRSCCPWYPRGTCFWVHVRTAWIAFSKYWSFTSNPEPARRLPMGRQALESQQVFLIKEQDATKQLPLKTGELGTETEET